MANCTKFGVDGGMSSKYNVKALRFYSAWYQRYRVERSHAYTLIPVKFTASKHSRRFKAKEKGEILRFRRTGSRALIAFVLET